MSTVKNRGSRCRDFESSRSQPLDCYTCAHRVLPPIAPTDIINFIGKDAREGLAKELEAVYSGAGTLSSAPQFLPYCDVSSRSGRYPIAVRKNPHGTCGAWTEGAPQLGTPAHTSTRHNVVFWYLKNREDELTGWQGCLEEYLRPPIKERHLRFMLEVSTNFALYILEHRGGEAVSHGIELLARRRKLGLPLAGASTFLELLERLLVGGPNVLAETDRLHATLPTGLRETFDLVRKEFDRIRPRALPPQNEFSGASNGLGLRRHPVAQGRRTGSMPVRSRGAMPLRADMQPDLDTVPPQFDDDVHRRGRWSPGSLTKGRED